MDQTYLYTGIICLVFGFLSFIISGIGLRKATRQREKYPLGMVLIIGIFGTVLGVLLIIFGYYGA